MIGVNGIASKAKVGEVDEFEVHVAVEQLDIPVIIT